MPVARRVCREHESAVLYTVQLPAAGQSLVKRSSLPRLGTHKTVCNMNKLRMYIIRQRREGLSADAPEGNAAVRIGVSPGWRRGSASKAAEDFRLAR